MEGRGHRQQDGPLGAPALRQRDGALDGRLVAGDDDLAGAVVVGDVADLALRRLAGDLGGNLDLEADERRHGADAYGRRVLHSVAADAQEPRRVVELQASSSGKRRVLAERVARHERGVPAQFEPGFGLEHPHHRHADGHECRLRV